MTRRRNQEEEVDLAEIFAAVFYNWWIVVIVVISMIFLSAFYAFVVASPEYKASTRFEILEKNQRLNSLDQAADLASLAGINLPDSASEADALQDRILSRPFVDSIYDEADFFSDPVFNTFLGGTSWTKKAIYFISGKDLILEPTRNDYLVWAIDALADRMELVSGDNGIIELIVYHPDGERAAKIANIIVEKALLDIFTREQNEIRSSLSYFADELLNVRADLDAASAAVRDFAISNSIQSAEELARISSQLAQVRRDKQDIEKSLLAIDSINDGKFVGSEFATKFPISTSPSFRRVLNLSGNPSVWKRPTEDEISNARDRFIEQIAFFESSLNTLEDRAQISGEKSLELSALNREVEVQQSIYQSVITQF